jgi:hypothetical protein
MNRIKNYRTAAQLVLAAAMAVKLLALPLASQAATYSYTDLTSSGFTRSDGFGISGSHQVGSGSGSATGNNNHALLWSGTASSVVDLNPSGFTESRSYGISGSQQVGWASGSATGSNQHAFLWSGTASSAVDLNPTGFTWSLGRANSGSQQIGYGYGPATGSNQHALLWSGTASSAVDLNPTGFTQSSGERIYGTHQVGRGSGPATGNIDHALLWSGTASSVVDLNPSGFTGSGALGISGSQQVGLGYGSGTGNNNHALLWSGSASSVVDLNPSGFTMSVASGISGSQQVGYGASGNNTHALLWSGTASSVVDLGSLLSSDYSTWSVAEGIDANGNIFGYAIYIPTGLTHAILWTAFPGPEHAIYRFVQHETDIGNGQLTQVGVRGYTVFEPDTQRGTTIGGFTINNSKLFAIVPLENYRVDHVSGANGATYTVLSKAESPGTQFAGTLLESAYSRGRDSTVTLGQSGARQLPKSLLSFGRLINEDTQTGVKFANEARGSYVLDINASQASNLANESFEATVARLANSFMANGYIQVTPPPAQ